MPMNCMGMMGGGSGWMMAGAGLVWLLVVAVLLLAIAALVKYLRSGPKKPTATDAKETASGKQRYRAMAEGGVVLITGSSGYLGGAIIRKLAGKYIP